MLFEHEIDSDPSGYQVTKMVKTGFFTGDTIFVGGCGRFFEGEPAEMVEAMRLARDKIPQGACMFVGHEYTVANLNFCLQVDPTNA